MSRPAPRPLNVALKYAIVLSGKYQDEVARDADVPSPLLSHAIYGRRTLTADQRARVAQALNRREAELFPEALPQATADPATV